MHIFIRDEFDLYKIIHSGQCFRAVEINDGLFRFITGRHVLYIRHIQGLFSMKTEIGAYEAKTKLPELLRQVKAGKQFTITNRGEAIADLLTAAAERISREIDTRLGGLRTGHNNVVDFRRV